MQHLFSGRLKRGGLVYAIIVVRMLSGLPRNLPFKAVPLEITFQSLANVAHLIKERKYDVTVLREG